MLGLVSGLGSTGKATPSSLRSGVASFVVAALPCLGIGLALGCTETRVTGQGEFGRPIPLASRSEAPLPRLAWHDGDACPGMAGGCTSYCEGPPESCPEGSCMPLLIDSGTPISILPGSGGTSVGRECIEVRAAEGLLDEVGADTLAQTTAAFRLFDAPILRAPRGPVGGWEWQVGDDLESATVGGVLGGNVLRDFAVEFRHPRTAETPSIAFYSEFPGDEEALADQGLAYVRLQYPGRLLGRLLNDECDLGSGVADCTLATGLSASDQELLFESTRALVDACVAPPPCAVEWEPGDMGCRLAPGDGQEAACAEDRGASATLVVATGVPGLVLFSDSAESLVGAPAALPDCSDPELSPDARACTTGETGSLYLPGWAPLDGLQRIRVRALGLVRGLDQASGAAPCERLRARLEGLHQQCEGFLAEGQPVRPNVESGESIAEAGVVLGEVSWVEGQTTGAPDRWLDTLIVSATAAPVIALRREITPEGAQPDGLIGGALLEDTETVLDFTEASSSPGVRVRCLDPGDSCVALPSCSADVGSVEFEGARAGRTSCCFGLPADLITQVVLGGEGKEAPRAEDACCAALPRAYLNDLQSAELNLCAGVE